MRMIQSVAPDLNAGLTNDNQLVVMIDNEYGEHLAEVTDIGKLVTALRHLELIQAENSATRPTLITTAEVELNRRASR